MNADALLRIRKDIKSKIFVSPVNVKTIQELIQDLQTPIFETEFEKRYAQQLQQLVFIFKIDYEGQSWLIRRTVQEFFALEKELNDSNFNSISKTKNDQVVCSLIVKNPNQTLFNLSKYLLLLTITEKNGNIPEKILTFLEISYMNLPLKFKECYMLTKEGGRESSFFKNIQTKFSQWEKKYFIITEQCLLYLEGPDQKNCKIQECLNFDPTFNFQFGKQETGEDFNIIIYFLQRKLTMKAESLTQYVDFIISIYENINQSPYTKIHRFGSFSPIRLSHCQWYVDGKDYFQDVYKAILQAKQMIFITDWWLSPEVHLKRPIKNQQEAQDYRLCSVLKQVADRGVIVLILLYNSSNLILYNNPRYSKQTLQSMSPNIKVLKHPQKIKQSLFSHHEKMVVIDQEIGFMGGLDLCFGRWDDNRHLLFEPSQQEILWPEIDFSNSRIRDFIDVSKYQKSLLKENEPRMPWHDIAIQIRGESVIDLSRHFTQYWNFYWQERLTNKEQILLIANDIKIENYINQSQSDIKASNKIDDIDHNIESFLKHQRKSQLIKQKKLLSFTSKEDFFEKQILQFSNEDKNQNINPRFKPQQFISKLVVQNRSQKTCITQLTRSSSTWSTGIKYTEHSIQNAYLELILNAKQFIYIENQFFISDLAGEPLKNNISSALVERIKRAHFEKQKFKVVVFLPLLPGFEGEIDQDNSTVLKIQLHYEYLTISRGGNSIIEQLTQAGINPSDYINFYGLRQHAKQENNLPVTEIIYIHSKLMIVDDETALIGSANINDRSLNGDRDSELAIIVQDQMLIDSYMNQQQVKIPKFAHTLRVNLYSEHFGLTYDQVKDPLSPHLYEIISFNTSNNVKIYREIFRCYPDDEITKISQYVEFKKKINLELYDKLSPQIIGFAVNFPFYFLCEENLLPKFTDKEQFVPEITFT